MPYLVDTHVLVDVSRNNQAAIAFVNGLGNDWALSSMAALELIAGAKNRREVVLIDKLIEVYETLPLNDTSRPDRISPAQVVCQAQRPADI
jgi:predicted nucleic acid-binding protein